MRRNPYGTYGDILSTLGRTYQTPAQMEAQAKRMATGVFKAGQSSVLAEAARARSEALSRQKAMAAAGRAAAEMSKGLIGDTGSAYGTAATELSSLARSLTGGVGGQNAADVAAANASLANVGAPAIAGSPGQQAVEEYLGGTLPVRGLTESGTAAAFGTAGLINAAQLRATQEANAAFAQASRDVARYRQQALKELNAGRTANAQQFLAAMQDSQRQAMSLALGALASQGDVRQRGIENRRAVQQTQWEQGFQESQAKTANEQWWAQYRQGVQQWQAENARANADTALRASLATEEQAKGGKEAFASFLNLLGENQGNRDFQQALATIYYSRPSVAMKQPARGSKDDVKRTNAVVNYFLRTYWPKIRLGFPEKQRAGKQQAFVKAVRGWLNRAPMPSLQDWAFQEKIARVKG